MDKFENHLCEPDINKFAYIVEQYEHILDMSRKRKIRDVILENELKVLQLRLLELKRTNNETKI